MKIVSCKQKIFSDDALRNLISKDSFLSNVSYALSSALLPAAKFAITGGKGKMRKSLILLPFLLLLFILFTFTHISVIFPRLVLNLNLSKFIKIVLNFDLVEDYLFQTTQ